MSGVPLSQTGKRSCSGSDADPPVKRFKQFVKQGFLERVTQVGPIHAEDWANAQFAIGDAPRTPCLDVFAWACREDRAISC